MTLTDAHHDGASLLTRRTRRTWWIVVVGWLGLGGALALLVGSAGGSGRVGFVVFLLAGAASCGIAALYATATLLYDELKGERIPLRRPLTAGGLFVTAAALMAMVAGLGG